MEVVNGSHTDHVSGEILAYVCELFADRDGFFIETIELPHPLGMVECGLHGPACGDEPVPEDEVWYESRNGRPTKSRLCARAPRPTQTLTVIAGPSGDHPCVLYTVFGGPLAPKEPDDATLPTDEAREASKAFWSQHALSE